MDELVGRGGENPFSDKEEIVDLANSNSSSTTSILCFLSITKHIHSY